jgi:signal transduction histidine kinase
VLNNRTPRGEIMVSFRNATIKQKLTWMSALTSTTALLLAASAFFAYHLVTFRSAIVRTLSIQADTIGLNSISPLRFNDDRSAEDTLSALRADRNIITAAVYAADGTLFATYAGGSEKRASIAPAVASEQPDTARFEGRTLEVSHAIVADGERLGTVQLAYSLDDLYADLARYIGIALLVLGVSVLAALIAASTIQGTFSQPIARLAAAAKAVSREKDYSLRVERTENRDELGILIDTFNEMLGEIQVRDVEVEAGKGRFQTLNEELEERVMRRTAELEATNKELEAFTYSVSHDLRAPLRRIDGFANLLVEEHGAQLSDEAARYLGRVREGTKQMGQLVDDLLNLARLGRKEVHLQVTGLSSIVAGVTAVLDRETADRAVEWKIDSLPFVECDPALMEVVFTNLLSNAVKCTRPRERAVIEIGSIEENGHRVIFVRDNGVGFSMKYSDKLFGVFQRLHRAEDFEGTGVGLATVQRIIHKHGGRIWANAELDKGACFYFTVGTRPDQSASELIEMSA